MFLSILSCKNVTNLRFGRSSNFYAYKNSYLVAQVDFLISRPSDNDGMCFNWISLKQLHMEDLYLPFADKTKQTRLFIERDGDDDDANKTNIQIKIDRVGR